MMFTQRKRIKVRCTVLVHLHVYLRNIQKKIRHSKQYRHLQLLANVSYMLSVFSVKKKLSKKKHSVSLHICDLLHISSPILNFQCKLSPLTRFYTKINLNVVMFRVILSEAKVQPVPKIKVQNRVSGIRYILSISSAERKCN